MPVSKEFSSFSKAVQAYQYLIRCICRVSHNTLLEFASDGSLADLLNKYQTRDEATRYMQVLTFSQLLPLEDARRWMRQLYRAAVGMEEAGMAHSDIRLDNNPFGREWNPRLSDLDRSVPIGDDLKVVSEPFGQLLSKSDGRGAGTYGKAAARTEPFYAPLRGHEPLETEYWGRNHGVIMMDKFQTKEFPPLTDSAEASIIRE